MLESDDTSIRHSTKQGRKSFREEELSRIVRNCEDSHDGHSLLDNDIVISRMIALIRKMSSTRMMSSLRVTPSMDIHLVGSDVGSCPYPNYVQFDI